MKTVVLTFVARWLIEPLSGALAALASPAGAFPYRAAVARCYDTQEHWIRHVTRNGEKIVSRRDFGAFMVLTVRWDSGAVHELTVGPHEDKFCVLATRVITPAAAAASN
jgi:hypothetical protein